MNKEELNKRYSRIFIRWQNQIQPGVFHTINEALQDIKKTNSFNRTGQYHIVTPYCKYIVTDPDKMELKKIQTFTEPDMIIC